MSNIWFNFFYRFSTLKQLPHECYKVDDLEIMMPQDKIKTKKISCDEFMNVVGPIYNFALSKDKYRGHNSSNYNYTDYDTPNLIYHSHRDGDNAYMNYKMNGESHRFVLADKWMSYNNHKDKEKTSTQYYAHFVDNNEDREYISKTYKLSK